jgi:hypothetical protein
VNGDRTLLSFLHWRVPPWFERRIIVLPPDQQHVYDAAESWGALVVVEHGQLELACVDGSRHHFVRGDVLWLHTLPVRALRNHGHEPVVLTAITRQTVERACLV